MCRIINFGVTNLIKTIFLYLSLSSELLVGGVVVEVHVAGGVNLLLCAHESRAECCPFAKNPYICVPRRFRPYM